MKKEEAQELFRKYGMGLCTTKEAEIITRWYESLGKDEHDVAKNDELDKIGKQMLENIHNRIDGEKKLKQPTTSDRLSKETHFIRFGHLMKMVAIFFSLAGVGYFIYDQTKNTELEGEVITSLAPSPSTIYLSDGSMVWLKGESQLIYPTHFSGNTREVTLIGEAYFDVIKDQKRPFIIHTSKFTTSVLGTSFNIKAYENAISHEVAVVTGKVLVSVKEDNMRIKEVILLSNQKAIFSQIEKSRIELKDVAHADYSALAKSRLVFKETSLGDVINVLNLAHNTKISLSNDNMKNCLITADLSRETLEMSIEILSKVINAEFTKKGDEIILSGQACRSEY